MDRLAYLVGGCLMAAVVGVMMFIIMYNMTVWLGSSILN